jgi:hypothetical protein
MNTAEFSFSTIPWWGWLLIACSCWLWHLFVFLGSLSTDGKKGFAQYILSQVCAWVASAIAVIRIIKVVWEG